MKTKELIIIKSLELFAIRGFESVSVRDIAKLVGVSESALYKHFKNKQDIFDTIIEEVSARIDQIYAVLSVPEPTGATVVDAYDQINLESLIHISCNLFCFYVTDDVVARFRRMLNIEQYRNSEVAKKYKSYFIDRVLESQTVLFGKFVAAGKFRKEDPYIIALHFYSPIYLLFQKYDLEPDKLEEAEEIIKQHVISFSEFYDNRLKK